MEMGMTTAEVKAFARELRENFLEPANGRHADFIRFIVGETYRDGFCGDPVSYRCVRRTPHYVTFEAVDPWSGDTVRFRRKPRIIGNGEPTAWVGYEESFKPPLELRGFPGGIDATDIVS